MRKHEIRMHIYNIFHDTACRETGDGMTRHA